MHTFDARLMESFNGLRFGATEKEAAGVFGEPEEKEVLDAMDGSSSLVWHYWSKGFTVFFDRQVDGHFCCVEVDSSVQLTLWSNAVFTMNEAQLKNLFAANGFHDIDEEFHEWGEKRISFDDAMADFYFENGILVSVNFGVLPPGDNTLLSN